MIVDRPNPPLTLMFQRCERGFIFREGGSYAEERMLMPSIWAFADIESAARWLIEQYALAEQGK